MHAYSIFSCIIFPNCCISNHLQGFIPSFYCTQLNLVGVCCSGSSDGIDPYSEVSLQSLPEYTIPSDGVTMSCIACTDSGHIFLAGRDGHIYGLQYTTGSGWQKRCRKVCLTAGLGSVISRYFLFSLPHPTPTLSVEL